MPRKNNEKKNKIKFTDRIAKFAGDIRFVYFHVVFFTVWIVSNIVYKGWWDPYPFIFLTLVVSLEAIFLSTFVLINQNKDFEHTERRAQKDYAVDKRAEEGIQEIKKQLRDIKRSLKENK